MGTAAVDVERPALFDLERVVREALPEYDLTCPECGCSMHSLVKQPSKLRVQCFGNFDVFRNGVPLYFPRRKAKELFAYLVHKRGASCSTQELITALYDDDGYSASLTSQVQTLISTMMKVLREVGAGDVVFKRHNSIAVNVEEIDCDYYRFLKRDEDAISTYTGEYMSNYSWAELTIGYLNRVVD